MNEVPPAEPSDEGTDAGPADGATPAPPVPAPTEQTPLTPTPVSKPVSTPPTMPPLPPMSRPTPTPPASPVAPGTTPGVHSAPAPPAPVSPTVSPNMPANSAQPANPSLLAGERDNTAAANVTDPIDHPAPAGAVSTPQATPVENSLVEGQGTPQPAGQLRIFAVANQKGGVGKTTTTVNLGSCLAELGLRTLIVDLDPQANASTGLGINPRAVESSMYDVLLHDTPLEDCIEATAVKNLFCAPASLDLAGAEIELVPAFNRERRLKAAIESVAEDYDYVLIDCPPSLGLLTVNGLTAATEVLVPIQCEYYALEGLGQLLRNVDLVKKNLNPELDLSTIVLVMFDARTKLASQVAKEVRDHFGPVVCRQVIPRSVRLSEAPSFGQPINVFDPTSRGSIAYRDLAREVSGLQG